MGPLDYIFHSLNFAAPALFVAVCLAVAGRLFERNRAGATATITQAAVNFIAGLAVLVAGLWFFGRDAKMATYAVLVLASASTQWLCARARRR